MLIFSTLQWLYIRVHSKFEFKIPHSNTSTALSNNKNDPLVVVTTFLTKTEKQSTKNRKKTREKQFINPKLFSSMLLLDFSGLIVLPTAIINGTPLDCTLCQPGICHPNITRETDPGYNVWWVKKHCTFTAINEFVLYFPYSLLIMAFIIVLIERFFVTIFKVQHSNLLVIKLAPQIKQPIH